MLARVVSRARSTREKMYHPAPATASTAFMTCSPAPPRAVRLQSGRWRGTRWRLTGNSKVLCPQGECCIKDFWLVVAYSNVSKISLFLTAQPLQEERGGGGGSAPKARQVRRAGHAGGEGSW